MTKIFKAALFAEKAHRGEFREPAAAGVPYITHPLAVAQLLEECGYREDEHLCAALLHDVIESAFDRFTAPAVDAWVAVGEPLCWAIKREFGVVVADAVYELTDPPDIGKEARRARQMNRTYSDWAAPVKICDKICNVRDLARTRPWPKERARLYLERAAVVVKKACRLETRDLRLVAVWIAAELDLNTVLAGEE